MNTLMVGPWTLDVVIDAPGEERVRGDVEGFPIIPCAGDVLSLPWGRFHVVRREINVVKGSVTLFLTRA